MTLLEKQTKRDKSPENLFKDSIAHLITELKDTKIVYFRRENDLTCFLYKGLFNKLNRKKELFIDYKGKRLFPIFTEHQYKRLDPVNYFEGKAIDMVFLSQDTKIKIALEVKFSTSVLVTQRKSSAGKKTLLKDINKLKKLGAPHSYLLYCKEGGNCFLTYDGKEREEFLKNVKFNNGNEFFMYYVEKADGNQSLNKFYIYTINQDYKLVKIGSPNDHNQEKHFNIIIHSNSKMTKRNSEPTANQKKPDVVQK